ncbi:response regulator [Lyngbya confervoides]|uniref:Response regulator transcription factor n=1 Tax=Lyngbya confervoides BDU141951 TaxID=1574623 RepID=A0ABD4T2Y5_9CYAN|nr:response regulator transcription factor [Lyngbya confervoides]MCM1982783.1 response regulator transcription factor [Lyngbya confervoides BDU141951]
MSHIAIVLIEDHDLTRMAMQATLERYPDFEVSGVAANGIDGVRLVHKMAPDVAVIDVGLPDIDGVEVTRRIKERQQGRSHTKILILTLRNNEEVVLAAFGAGADSYCMKDAASTTLIEAVKLTAEGQSWIDPAIAGIVLRQARHDSFPQPAGDSSGPPRRPGQFIENSPLTERELEVLQLIVDGYSNAMIAEQLFITVGTVKTHVRNILNKLCADDRTQAAVRALRSGLVN